MGAVQVDVEKLAAELMWRLRPAVKPSETFAKIWEWWARMFLQRLKSKVSFESRVRLHLLPAFGQLTSETLTTSEIEELFAGLEKRLGPQTLNHIRNHGRRIIEEAQKNNKWPKETANPFSDVAKRVIPEMERQMLTRAQAVAVLDGTLRPHHRAIFAIAIYLGLRKNEILRLRVDDVDLEGRTLSVLRTKVNTRAGRHSILPIPDELLPYLEAARAASTGRFLFSRPDGSALRNDHRLQLVLRRTIARVLKKTVDITFHGLRHCAATLHRKAGADPLCVHLLLGHSPKGLSVTDSIYTHVDEDYMRQEIGKLKLRQGPASSTKSLSARLAQLDRALASEAKGHPRSGPGARSGIPKYRENSGALKVQEAARMLGASPDKIRRFAKDGTLQSFWLGRDIRVLRASVEAFIARGGSK